MYMGRKMKQNDLDIYTEMKLVFGFLSSALLLYRRCYTEVKLVFGFCRERFYYAEGVKPLITPNKIRGEEAKQRTTPTELNFMQQKA